MKKFFFHYLIKLPESVHKRFSNDFGGTEVKQESEELTYVRALHLKAL